MGRRQVIPFGNTLAQSLEELDVAFEELARMVGVHRSLIYRVAIGGAGSVVLSYALAAEIADVLDRPVEWVFDRPTWERRLMQIRSDMRGEERT